jgi:hypothetical protein
MAEKAKETCICKICNFEVTKCKYVRHTRSKRHINNLKNQ